MVERTVSLALFLVLAAGLLGAGLRLLGCFRQWPERPAAADLGLACAAALGAATLALFLVGALGLLGTPAAWGLFALVLLAGLPALPLTRPRDLLRAMALPRRRGPRLAALALGLLLFLQLLDGTNFLTGADAVEYHFPIVKEMVERGSLEPAPYIMESGMMPQNAHLLFAWGTLLYSDLVGKLFPWLFEVASLLLLFGIARRLFGRAAAWAAVLIFAFTPWTNYKTRIPLVEMCVALYLLACAEAFLRGRESGERRWWWTSALFLGLCMGTKQSSWVAAPLLAGFLLWTMVREERRGWRPSLGIACGLLAAAAAAASPWYLRNWVYLGNPVWPAFFGGAYLPADYVPWNDLGELQSVAATLETLPIFFRTLLLSYGKDCFSFFHPLLGILGPWVLARSLRDRRLLAFSLLAIPSLLYTYFLAVGSARYWLPFYALFCAALGLAFAALSRRPLLRRPAWAVFSVALLGTLSYEALALYQGLRTPDRVSYEETVSPPRRICRACEDAAPPGKRILALAATNLYFRRPAAVASLHQGWIPLCPLEGPEDLLERLREREVGVVLLDRRLWEGEDRHKQAVREGLARLAEGGRLEQVLEEERYLIYRL